MGKMKKVGFNVEIDKWERFKKLAKANQSDTNKELRKFIDKYLIEHNQLFLQLEEKGGKK